MVLVVCMGLVAVKELLFYVIDFFRYWQADVENPILILILTDICLDLCVEFNLTAEKSAVHVERRVSYDASLLVNKNCYNLTPGKFVK